jgi:RND family efflux transporter MFP subunit
MKRLKLIIVLMVIVGAIAAILVNNKNKIEARSKTDKLESYAVTIAEAEKRKIESNLEMVGTITGNNDVAVVAEASGKVIEVHARVGDYKTAGSILFKLDDELKLAALKTAEVNYQKSKKDYSRFEALYKGKAVTDAQFENSKLAYQSAEANYIVAKREYEDAKIKAPISGVVTSRVMDIGSYVNRGTVVAEIVDISKLKVKLNVGENDVFKLKQDDKVEIRTDVYPGAAFTGKIETISSKGDEAHTYPVEVSFANSKEHPLKAGMFGKVKFIQAEKSESVLIPRDALIGSIKSPRVFTVGNGIASLREIVIGSVYDNYLEVLNGINPGDKVIINGQNNIKDNDKVIIRN